MRLIELARLIWGANPTREQIETTRHEFTNFDYDETDAYDFQGGSYEQEDDGA